MTSTERSSASHLSLANTREGRNMAKRLQQMNVGTRLLLGLLFSLAVAASAAADPAAAPGPWGIDDPSIQSGVLRTEFDDPRAGTAARPLLVDCEASAYPALCADIDTVFRESNSYTIGSRRRPASYWMLTVNNDKSFVERCEEAGPPDQSMPISAPGTGLAGIGVFADANWERCPPRRQPEGFSEPLRRSRSAVCWVWRLLGSRQLDADRVPQRRRNGNGFHVPAD